MGPNQSLDFAIVEILLSLKLLPLLLTRPADSELLLCLLPVTWGFP